MSGYENFTLAVILWSAAVLLLGIPAWPWIKRVRVGLAPPDAELRKAQEAQKRLFSELKKAYRELHLVRSANERLSKKLRETEQERDALRAENEELIAERKQPGVQSGDEELKQRCLEVSTELF